MQLEFKPDFEEAQARWRAYWDGSLTKRPCIAITARKPGAAQPPPMVHLQPLDIDSEEYLGRVAENMATVYYGGEAMPCWHPNLGPDMFSAFVGAELKISKDSEGTSWAVPFVEDWEAVLPFKLNESSPAWLKVLELYGAARKVGQGKFICGMIDYHTNADCLSSIRSPGRLATDLIDCPDKVLRALADVRALFGSVYDRLFAAGGMEATGTSSWLPFYSEGKYCALQCDFICMISKPMFRRFVLPELEAETQHLDHCVYHLDGPGALHHLDDLLALKHLNGIQWVPGAGNPDVPEWPELIERILAADKRFIASVPLEKAKEMHRRYRSMGIYYTVGAASPKEADEALRWFERNT